MINTRKGQNLILSYYLGRLLVWSFQTIVMNKVICMDWRGIALERIAVGANERVYYIAFPKDSAEFSTELPPIGLPKGSVFEFAEQLADRKLSAEGRVKLKRYEG